MNSSQRFATALSVAALAALIWLVNTQDVGSAPQGAAAVAASLSSGAPLDTVPGMPKVSDPHNLYSDTAANQFSAVVKGDLSRIYVPNLRGNNVSVLDPETLKVVDPYNMYFSPDGKSAIAVAEARKRLDFRDPVTMALQYAIETPQCGGINHADFSIDGRYALFTCEFAGSVAKIDLVERKVVGYLKLAMPQTRLKDTPIKGNALTEPPATEICTSTKGMPQDIRVSPDGKRFYVADRDADGVHIIDGERLKEIGFVATGVASRGLYPSRDGKLLYVANRGSHKIHGPAKGPGSVTVLGFATDKVVARWPIPGRYSLGHTGNLR